MPGGRARRTWPTTPDARPTGIGSCRASAVRDRYGTTGPVRRVVRRISACQNGADESNPAPIFGGLVPLQLYAESPFQPAAPGLFSGLRVVIAGCRSRRRCHADWSPGYADLWLICSGRWGLTWIGVRVRAAAPIGRGHRVLRSRGRWGLTWIGVQGRAAAPIGRGHRLLRSRGRWRRWPESCRRW